MAQLSAYDNQWLQSTRAGKTFAPKLQVVPMHMHNRLVWGWPALSFSYASTKSFQSPSSWTTECPFTFEGVTVGNMTVFNATCTLNGTISDNPLPCRPNFIDISGTRIALYCYAVKEHEGGSNRTLG
ncbi:hypothetical protein Hamer_G021584 [Homarus americanus]|uniref:Uncharacterized protein n=1 Tax=Homarus americanus TaxID=6706 RepID=A0A8J5MZT0_HOMAM|nr:hypothetical protein Hamer_G021584 [Homarus americanus]